MDTGHRPRISQPTQVTGRAANDVWALGLAGIAHYDGSRWEPFALEAIQPPGTKGMVSLNAIAVIAGEVFVAGTRRRRGRPDEMRSPSLRTAAVALSALLIPVLWIGVDLTIRGALFSTAGAALQSTYAAGMVLSLLVWGFAMEAARHPHRLVRTAAMSFVGFIAAFGIGLQSFARALTHAYVGRRAVMLALGVPDLAHAGYFAKNALLVGGVCLIPAALAVGLALFRRRRFGRLHLRPSAVAGGALAAVLLAMFTPFAAQGLQGLPPDVLLLHGTGGPLLHAMGVLGAPRSLPRGQRAPIAATTHVGNDAPSIVFVLGERAPRRRLRRARGRLRAQPARR